MGMRVRALAVLAATGALLSIGAAAAPAAQREGGRDVLANLFEWNWPSVAHECTAVLGPKGYAGVQVAPPQDSLSRSGPSAPIHPWWEVYQPVDYDLTSRMGDEAQFREMVATCRRAGVKVYVDAVINHMTGQGDTSYGGRHYSKYVYKGLYGYDDFHHFPDPCTEPDNTIHDFNNWREVTKCELVGLSDLKTETAKVRATLARYLNKLIRYGVSGFRVDAAKHIGQEDLRAIYKRLHRTQDGTRPYWALEVPPGGPGRLATRAFTRVGSVLGFDYATQIHDAFKSYTTTPTGPGNITDLRVFGVDSGLIPSDRELVFIENHDTERNGSTLNYKDGPMNTLATEFMLAWPHGTPQVYASFKWGDDTEQGPPSDPKGFVLNTDCRHGWACVDRFRGVANMVRWHNIAGRTRVRNWYDDTLNLIAFSRGSRAWIALNHHATDRTITVRTGLPAGTYCDIIHGNLVRGACTGPAVTVRSDGRATVTVPGNDAVAIHRRAQR